MALTKLCCNKNRAWRVYLLSRSCSLAYFVVALRKRDFMMRKGGDCSSIFTATQPHSPSYILCITTSFFTSAIFLYYTHFLDLSDAAAPFLLFGDNFPLNVRLSLIPFQPPCSFVISNLLFANLSLCPFSLSQFLLGCLCTFTSLPLSLSHPSPTALVCTRSGDAGGGKMERDGEGKGLGS